MYVVFIINLFIFFIKPDVFKLETLVVILYSEKLKSEQKSNQRPTSLCTHRKSFNLGNIQSNVDRV